MARLNLPPPPRVAIGSATVGGRPVQVTLDPEWARYFDSLNSQVNVTTATVAISSMAGASVMFGGGDSDAGGEFIPGPKGPQGDPGPMAALFLDGGNTEAALEFVQGPRGPQGESGAVIALMEGDDSPTEVISRPASSASDVNLGNVTNDTQTKAAIVPNTAPSAGQILVGNAGGTAYAPVSASGAFTLASTGAATIATPGTLTVASTNSTATAHTHAITSSSAPGAAASLLATDASGHLGSTGTRIVKGWFVDITATNAIAGSVTGSAATWTTARNLAGNSVDGSANVAFANKFIVQGTADAGLSAAQFLGALATGIVKNTTTTGVLSIAAAGSDYVAPGGALGTPSSGTLTNCTGLPSTSVTMATTTFTATATGMTTSPTGTVLYAVIGNLVILYLPSISGTSNATTFTLTGMPAAIRPAATKTCLAVRVQDNSSGYLAGMVQIASTGVISVFKDIGGTAFTAANIKSIGDCCIAYPIQ